jgi:hypothetical protein
VSAALLHRAFNCLDSLLTAPLFPCCQEQIEDYVGLRVEKKKNPISFVLVGAQKVVNPFLQARFEQCKQRFKAAGKSGERRVLARPMTRLIPPARAGADLRHRVAFHGTRMPNVSRGNRSIDPCPASCPSVDHYKLCCASQIKKICDKGLLRVGHPLNPSKAVDEGFFGMPQHGIYVSRYADYTFKVRFVCFCVAVSQAHSVLPAVAVFEPARAARR